MNIDDLTIGEAKALAAMFPTERIPEPTVRLKSKAHGMQIVVLDRGFVYVGETCIDGDWVHIEDARCIRVWGTTKGLGELRDGPTSSTKLDDTGTVRAPLRALIALIEVDGKKWARK